MSTFPNSLDDSPNDLVLRDGGVDKVAIVTRRAHHTKQVFTASRVSKDTFILTPTVLTVNYRPDISRAASTLTSYNCPRCLGLLTDSDELWRSILNNSANFTE